MDVASINSNTSFIRQASSEPGSSDLGKQDFLQLLVTQLRNQDPVNPMEGAEFASQLAQFNSVEQLVNVNSGLEKLAQQQEAMSNGLVNTMASTLTGKQVKVHTNQLALGESGKADIQFKLDGNASDTEVVIRDQDGTVVRTENLSNLGKGDHSWQWDGRTESGKKAPEGEYTVEINAKDGDAKVKSTSFVRGEISRIRFSGEGVKLMVNGLSVSLGDVEEIGEVPQSSEG
jgi:flagellar basal-body rod modification protein FlgD